MEFLGSHATPHAHVPNCDCTINMTYWGKTSDARRSLRLRALLELQSQRRSHLVFHLEIVGWVETNFIHLWQVLAVHLIDILSASDIPNLDHLVSSHRNGERSIKWRLDRVYISLMSLEVSYILSLLCVPYLNIILHESSWEKNCWVKWVKANSSYYCFMSFELHLQDLFVITISIQIIKVRGHHNLDHFIITSSGNKSACLTPVHTVDAAVVMVWLFKYHLDAFISALAFILSNTKWS